MTWDQVRALADSGTGLTIGSHAHGHHKLAGLDEESQRNELNAVEANPGRPPRPRGRGAGVSLRLARHIHRVDQSARR